MDSLYVIIPVYNEEKTLERVVGEWYPIVEAIGNESKIVLVNDGSSDRSKDIAEKLVYRHHQIELLNKKNGGHGSALIYGYKYAIDREADWILQTDSDGQTNPKEFAPFWKLRNKYDAVVGCRKVRGDGIQRAFVERILCIIIKIIFGIKLSDANAPFRLMKSSLVKKYISKFPNGYNLPNVMLTVYFVYFKERVAFKEVSFKSRVAGTNKINARKIIKIGIFAIIDFIRFKRNINK